MSRVVVLIVAAVILAVFVFIIEIKLRGGERKISDGRQKLAKYDNWFVRLFFKDKLLEGRQMLSYGKKKLAFAKCLRSTLALLCIACIVTAFVLLQKQ